MEGEVAGEEEGRQLKTGREEAGRQRERKKRGVSVLVVSE